MNNHVARIYVVQAMADGAETLVRATHASRAERHVSAPQFRTRIASKADLERLLVEGHRVQEAEPEPEDVRGT